MSKPDEHAVEAVTVEHEQSPLGLPQTPSVSGNVETKEVRSVCSCFRAALLPNSIGSRQTDVKSIFAGRVVRCYQGDAYSPMEQILYPALL